MKISFAAAEEEAKEMDQVDGLKQSDRLRVPKSESQANAGGAGDGTKLTRKSSTVIMDLKLKVSQLFRCELKDEHEVREFSNA